MHTIRAWLNRVPLSREGLFWFLLASGLLVVGLTKSINLITLLACFLVVLVLWNYVLARRQLGAVRATRLRGEPAFAGTPHRLAVRVHNDGKRGLSELRIQAGLPQVSASWFLTRLAAGELTVVHTDVTYPRRGQLNSAALWLLSGYPLGLALVCRKAEAGQSLIVLPRLGRLQRGVLRRLLGRESPSIGQSRGFTCPVPTAQSEFHGLRTYRPGDSPRHIHWRTTARRGEMMVREFEEWPNDDLILVVAAVRQPNVAPDDEDPLLEKTIRVAATICWEWCRQKGDRLTLLLLGAEPTVLSGVTGRALALRMLERLALEPGCTAIDPSAIVPLLAEAHVVPAPVLVLGDADGSLAGRLRQALHRDVAAVEAASGAAAFYEEGTVPGAPAV